jgi:Ni2+-binding GTPase involved in maturation of urease and hydrogenase
VASQAAVHARHVRGGENRRRVRPDIEILECSARSGAGMAGWLDFLRHRAG